MDMKEFQQFLSQLEDILWYPRVFIRSKNGTSWDDIPARKYFSTAWMDFFRDISAGTYYSLIDEISEEPIISHFRGEIEKQLVPLLAELESMEPERNVRKIKVKVDVKNFGRYAEDLKQMSKDKIIFDIIQDDEDIRDSYFVEANPEQILSYLRMGLRKVLDRYCSADLHKIRELENRIRELDALIQQKNVVYTLYDSERREQLIRIGELQSEVVKLSERNQHLEHELSEYHLQDNKTDKATIDPSSAITDGRLRMYFFYKLGFLDRAIWKEGITYEQMGLILQKILGGEPIKAGTASRDAKLFNATGSLRFKDFEMKNEHKVLDYLKSICPKLDFPKGKCVNSLKKR